MEKQVILNDFHVLPSAGHAGIRRMLETIKRRFYWPKMSMDIKEYVEKCQTCQKCKYDKRTKQPMEITTTASFAFQRVWLDLVGPIETDLEGYKYVFTAQCDLTKYAIAAPMKDKSAETVAKTFVQSIVLNFGIHLEISHDSKARSDPRPLFRTDKEKVEH